MSQPSAAFYAHLPLPSVVPSSTYAPLPKLSQALNIIKTNDSVFYYKRSENDVSQNQITFAARMLHSLRIALSLSFSSIYCTNHHKHLSKITLNLE